MYRTLFQQRQQGRLCLVTRKALKLLSTPNHHKLLQPLGLFPNRTVALFSSTTTKQEQQQSINMSSQGNNSKCPFSQLTQAAMANDIWWPNRLNLRALQQKNINNPNDPDFDYAKAFSQLDIKAVQDDINKMLTTTSQYDDWWPADYGNYAPFMIRMAWHAAGTYRIYDGRGGAKGANQRFAPLNSWPDNGNLDKARRLLWPIKQKYGRALSWGDLMILVGNQSLEIMGLKPFGFAGGRVDLWASEDDTYWGPEEEMLADNRHTTHPGTADIDKPLGAVQMGLIYVNPEGPLGDPDPLKAAADIRETFASMAMNDYETVALIAGGHTFGKAHGAAPETHVGAAPEGAPVEDQQIGYRNDFGTGKGPHTITSGLEGAWTGHPTKWDMGYFENLYKYEWECHEGPGGKKQWRPKNGAGRDTVPDAHDRHKKHAPMMFTTDLALIQDPIYAPISKHFYENPDEFADAFAKAWYKLTHRDMGPVSRCLGNQVPEAQVWQDPIPPCDRDHLIDKDDIAHLKTQILQSSGVSQLVRSAWAAACTFRCTDYRGGGNGGRLRLEPQRNWEVNNPTELGNVLQHLEMIQRNFNEKNDKKRVSLADLIVLGGCAAIESAAKKAGVDIEVPFAPGRMDSSAEQTDVAAFAPLEPKADGFRNFLSKGQTRPAEELLVDRAHLLGLDAPEMTVLVGGMRALNANADGSNRGVLTTQPETLTNDFFVNLLSMDNIWERTNDDNDGTFVGRDRKTGKAQWTASRVDLIFGSSSELRAISEYYACDDARETFVKDFVAAWTKVMDADRFDL